LLWPEIEPVHSFTAAGVAMRRLALVLLFAAACGGSSSGSGSAGPVDDGGSLPPVTTPDAGAPVADAGTTPGDAGTTVDAGSPDAGGGTPLPVPDAGMPADAGSPADAGLPDAGAPIDGGTAGGNPGDGGTGLACHDVAPCDVSEPTTTTATVCTPDPIPQEPVQFAFDGGIPGPCDEDLFDNTSALEQRTTATYDSQLHQLTQTISDGTGHTVHTLQDVYDSCGNLLWQKQVGSDGSTITVRNHYGADGLLAQTDTQQGGTCTSAARGYQRDPASGRIAAIYDPKACAVTQTLTYGTDGKVSEVDTAAAPPDNVTGTDNFSWFADGQLQEHDNKNGFGSYDDRTFDEQGRIVNRDTDRGLSSSGDDSDDVFTFRSDGQLQEHDNFFQGISCQDSRTTLSNTFTGSLLTSTFQQHDDLTGCINDVVTADQIDFTYAGNVRTGVHSDPVAGQVTATERSTLDSRGNELTHDSAQPGGAFMPVFTRGFNGCGLPPAP
jgi:hypothetical protein